jgi:hypothetical protein
MTYWLHFYSQRQVGREDHQLANIASTKSPATFLLGLQTNYPGNDNLLRWSVEITKAEFLKLKDHL